MFRIVIYVEIQGSSDDRVEDSRFSLLNELEVILSRMPNVGEEIWLSSDDIPELQGEVVIQVTRVTHVSYRGSDQKVPYAGYIRARIIK